MIDESRKPSLTGLQSFKFKNLSKNDLSQLLTNEHAGPATQKKFEDLQVEAEAERLATHGSLLQDLLCPTTLLLDVGAALVDDSFNRCFKSQSPDPWNWNVYLFPLWCCGVLVRYGLLFPIRVVFLMLTFLLFFICFGVVHNTLKGQRRVDCEAWLCKTMCQAFAASWTAVIRYHGPRPVGKPNHVWVANHTSMIDYIILCSYQPTAVIMQLHPGWVGFMQTRVLDCLGCLWFKRTEVKDRKLVAERMKAHVKQAGATPLLIFPEGTCVNNEYCVMFKRGAFDLGATVCPVAIKYNKIFVDAFWNSKKQSFTAHLVKLMCSWAVVCDVYFLEPQQKGENETAQQFAERVQHLIAKKAQLKVAPWDGYLKYYNLAEKHPDLIERRQRLYANLFKKGLAVT